MALNLPSELAEVLHLLGMDWPQLDEDEIHRAARLVRQFRSDLEGTIAVANSTINDGVGKALSAQTSGSYTDAWNESREAHMVKLLDLLDTAADGIDVFGHAVLGLKEKVIAELIITAAQLTAAVAGAFVSFGLSAAATPAIIFARKKIMDIVVGEVVAAVLIQVVEMVIEPLTSVAEAVIAELLDAPIVSGAVGEAAEFKADLVALEQVADDLDSNGYDQERLGEEFIAQISALQISTAA